MAIGIWYEQMARWVGHASSAFAIGQVVVKHRKDEQVHASHITFLTMSTSPASCSRAANIVCWSHRCSATRRAIPKPILGDKGTFAFITPNNGEPYLLFGKKGGAMGAVTIDPAKLGGWRVEEEFVNAVRNREVVTHTDFVTAVKYMEWTDAVTMSMRERREVQLPLV